MPSVPGLGWIRRGGEGAPEDPGPIPPADLKRRAGRGVVWAPLAPHWYASMPEKGREIQRTFYDKMEHTLAGLKVQRGRALVVVPARNEAQDIRSTLDRLLESTASDKRVRELAVVDNNSTDGTVAAIRAWKTEHAAELSKAGLTLHLLEQPIPGKTGALLTVKKLFEERGAYPEWMVQVDADTRIQPGNISKLIGLAEARGQVAATGNVRGVRRDGRHPFGGVQLGGTTDPVLIGNFVVARSVPWMAAYETIRDEYPQAATEDKLMTAIFRVSGFSTGSRVDAPDVTYETLAASTVHEARSQMTRWLTGDVQVENIYGRDLVKEIGLRGTSSTELKRAIRHLLGYPLYAAAHPIAATKEQIGSSAENVKRPFRIARALAPTLKTPVATIHDVIAFQTAALHAARDAEGAAEKAEAEGHYSWTPGR